MDGRPNRRNNAAYSNYSGVVPFTRRIEMLHKSRILLKINNAEIINTPFAGIEMVIASSLHETKRTCFSENLKKYCRKK